jgi:hypothetical protein
MSSFPCVVRTVSGAGEIRYSLGHRLVDRYLEFVAGRSRPNTLRAVAFDLKAFFAVVGMAPAEITAADVFDFLADQRGTAAWSGWWTGSRGCPVRGRRTGTAYRPLVLQQGRAGTRVPAGVLTGASGRSEARR